MLWTDEEVSIIMEFFGKIPHKELLKKLSGRTISTLTSKGARLGLAKKHIDYKLQMTLIRLTTLDGSPQMGTLDLPKSLTI